MYYIYLCDFIKKVHQYISVLLSQLLFQSYQATIGWLHQEANRNPQTFPLLDYRKHEDGYSLQPF